MHEPDVCPANPAEVAEDYIMGTLSEAQVIEFEDHYIGCDRCATVLQKAADYVVAMRAAGKSVRSGLKASAAGGPQA